ncbi:MAG: magnesium and cobalt transport protein CorA [Acidobacteria bacterium]|nr:MAG: magnesium and cobalt transport protein CorA [Acidobacteriota bacterium]
MLTYFQCVDGKVRRIDRFTPEMFSPDPKVLHWIDLDTPTPEEARILEDPFHFHPLAIEDCLVDVNHPKVDDYDAYIFLIVHAVGFDDKTGEFRTSELDMFLGRNYLVTHHEGPIAGVVTAQEQCARGVITSMPRGVDFLLYQILDQLFERYIPNLDLLEERIETVQSEVFEAKTADVLEQIFDLKRDVSQLRRICTPERELVHRLSRGEFAVIGPKATVYFRDIYDNLYRIVDASYQYHDMIQGLLDAYLSVVNNRLNETMKRLAAIGAVFAAVTVIAGVYGMNFEHMPELHWKYGYPYALGLMVSASAALLWWFRRKQWI